MENGKQLSALSPDIISSLVLGGDLSKLNPIQKVQYYNTLCERIGLDPTTQPFKILRLNNKEVLYADKGATQQLCKIYNISTEVTKKEKIEDVYVVTVRAKLGDRFTDEDGAVTIGSLKGDMLANALMKAVTKAKRRAVLSIVGLGMLDETDVETINGAEKVEMTSSKPEITVEPKALTPIQPAQENSATAQLDAKEGHPGDESEKISKEEGVELLKLAARNGYNSKDVKEYITGLGYSSHKSLSRWDLSTVIKRFEVPAADYKKRMEGIDK